MAKSINARLAAAAKAAGKYGKTVILIAFLSGSAIEAVSCMGFPLPSNICTILLSLDVGKK